MIKDVGDAGNTTNKRGLIYIERMLLTQTTEHKIFQSADGDLIKLNICQIIKQASTNFKGVKTFRICSLTTVELS